MSAPAKTLTLEQQLAKAEASLKYREGKVAAWSRQVEAAKTEIARLKREIADRPVPAKGFDVSNNNNRAGGGRLDAKGNVVVLGIDFAKAKADGYRFCLIKSGEGDWRDPFFVANVKAAKAAGLKVGAYHWVKPRTDRTGAKESSFFVARLKEAGLGKGDLRPAADSEEMKSGLSRTAILDYEFDFLSALEAAGLRPLNYTFPTYLAPPNAPVERGLRLGNWGQRFKRWPLWLADYSGPLDVPHPWTAADVLIHQESSKGVVAGISGAVDLNRTDDLRRLLA